MNMADPDHSEHEPRFIVLGLSERDRLLVVSYTPTGRRERESLARGSRLEVNEGYMNKIKAHASGSDKDTVRREYDFSKAVRGVTAARFAEGTNVVLLDPDVAEIFPDSSAVNEALRTIASPDAFCASKAFSQAQGVTRRFTQASEVDFFMRGQKRGIRGPICISAA